VNPTPGPERRPQLAPSDWPIGTKGLAVCGECRTLQAVDVVRKPGVPWPRCWSCGKDAVALVGKAPCWDDLFELADRLKEAVDRYDEADRQVQLLGQRNVQLHAEYGRLLGRGRPRSVHRDYWIGLGTAAVGVAIAQLLRLWGVL